MTDRAFTVELRLQDGYQFDADFGVPGVPPLRTDEPPPLGEGGGPNPARLLAAAIGNCLGASLLFCLRKARVDVQGLTVRVEGTMARTPTGRLRIGGVRVALQPEVPAEQRDRVSRCAGLYEDFCIVTESVRHGVTVETAVDVRTAAPAPAAV